MSRLNLHIKASIFRFLQTLGRWCDNYLSIPLPNKHSFKRRVPSTIGSKPGSFDILFYTPPSYIKPSATTSSSTNLTRDISKHPLLINFHGGGYTIGHASDDARWATAVTTHTQAVVASVDYRLAPSYPFPTGISDCVSAILYLWSHASELNIDTSRTALSGFSAGGNFCFAVAYLLHQELAKIKEEGRLEKSMEEGRLVSIAAFYPAVDWTKSRAERNASNPNIKPLIPSVFFGLFDESYLYPKQGLDMHSELLSPGLASEELLKEALPQRMVMITAWGDGLLAEGERFRERLIGVGKRVDGYTVQGVEHGWDKWPSWWKGDEKRDRAYGNAVETLREVWG